MNTKQSTKPSPRLCENCKFWLKFKKNNFGYCRRYPPSQAANEWPVTLPDAWCGEFADRKIQ